MKRLLIKLPVATMKIEQMPTTLVDLSKQITMQNSVSNNGLIHNKTEQKEIRFKKKKGTKFSSKNQRSK